MLAHCSKISTTILFRLNSVGSSSCFSGLSAPTAAMNSVFPLAFCIELVKKLLKYPAQVRLVETRRTVAPLGGAKEERSTPNAQRSSGIPTVPLPFPMARA
jgi:hypothetical protein